MKIIFFEDLDLVCLLRLKRLLREYDEIFYFNISKTAGFFLPFIKFSKRVTYYDFALYKLEDDREGSYVPRIYGSDLIRICDKATGQILTEDHFVKDIRKVFDDKKMLLFFRKLVAIDLFDKIIYMNAIRWKRQGDFKWHNCDIEFVIEKTPFFRIINEFSSHEYNINLIGVWSLKAKMRRFILSLRNLSILLSVLLNSVLSGCVLSLKGTRTSRRKQKSLMAMAYRYYGITFDKATRCDFPWLLQGDIPYDQVLIYFDSKHSPVTANLIDKMKNKPVRYMAWHRNAALSKDVPIRNSTGETAKKMVQLMGKILISLVREVFHLRFFGFYYLDKVIMFVNEYSQAYDFYKHYNITINIDREDSNPFLIARHIAMKDVGGLSISYQQPNWSIPNVLHGSCADVVFLFGPHYYDIFTKCGSDNVAVVCSGFLTDYSFNEVKERSKRLRAHLVSKGARFIITYFDENSTDGKMSIIPHKRSADIYRELLLWVLSDGEIGLVCSPKKPATLLRRIPGITDIKKEAEETGRCIFMGGEIRTDNYPTEAAQAADIAIASLAGGTTAMESFLSGVRTLYLDSEKFYGYPEYKNGRNRIVFDDISHVISAINEYRFRSGHNDLGDITNIPDISRKDPFRDGRAAERVGQFMLSLLEGFAVGQGREEAIKSATDRYRQNWGQDNVVSAGNKHDRWPRNYDNSLRETQQLL